MLKLKLKCHISLSKRKGIYWMVNLPEIRGKPFGRWKIYAAQIHFILLPRPHMQTSLMVKCAIHAEFLLLTTSCMLKGFKRDISETAMDFQLMLRHRYVIFLITIFYAKVFVRIFIFVSLVMVGDINTILTFYEISSFYSLHITL